MSYLQYTAKSYHLQWDMEQQLSQYERGKPS